MHLFLSHLTKLELDRNDVGTESEPNRVWPDLNFRITFEVVDLGAFNRYGCSNSTHQHCLDCGETVTEILTPDRLRDAIKYKLIDLIDLMTRWAGTTSLGGSSEIT